MDKIKIPKFDSETDEANWAYEHREVLGIESLTEAQEGRVHRGTLKRGMRVEAALLNALQTTEMVVAPEKLNGRTLVSVLRERLASK